MASLGNNANFSSLFRLLQPGPRPKELTGAIDLLAHHGLGHQYEAICSKPLPASIAESDYLRRVVGDIEIRRGEGMELGQLIERPDFGSSHGPPIAPLDVETLRSAFTFREAGPATLPESERGLPTISGNAAEQKEAEKKHKRHKDKDKDKEKRKDRDKDKDKKDREKDKRKDKSVILAENGDEKPRKHKKKKRKREGEEDKEGEDRKHKKKRSKHSSKGTNKDQLTNGI